MDRTRAITVLRSAEAQIRELGASSIFLFGSTARGEAGLDSDIDVFIDRDPQKPFGMMQLTGLKFLLEDLLGTSVDVGTRTSLHPAIRASVEREAIRVF